ncbi:MAG: BatD family protein [Pseudobdellovibrionaceae bacterium]
MTKIGNFLFFLSFIFFTVIARANTTVSSSVDRNEIDLGDTLTVTVSVVSDEDMEAQDPRVPELDGFDLMNSSQSTAVAQKLVNTSSGMQFETQRRKEFHYMLSPKRAGSLNISAFEVVVNGKAFRTQPIGVKVGNHPTAQPKNKKRTSPGSGMPGFDDPFDSMDSAEEEMFNQLLRQRQRLLQQQMQQMQQMAPDENLPSAVRSGMPNAAFRSLPTNPNEAFFISVEIDKTEVYEGEQVTVNWYLYTRGQMETLDRLKFPDLRGFWKEIIEEVPSIQFYEEVVNGVPWKKALLASHALFPIKAGNTVVVDEYKIRSRVRLPAQGLGGFFGRPYEYTRSSARVPIKVKPLPVEGRPSDFTGAVGQFEVSANVDNKSVPVNQPVSVKIRFEGSGNAKLIDLPAINWPTGLEPYDTKNESKFFKNGRSYKEFEVLVIPRQEGKMTIPAMSISMFDPQGKKYYTRSTQPIELTIVNNPNAPVGSSSRLTEAGKPAAPVVSENKLPEPIMVWSPAAQASVLYRPWMWFLIYGSVLSALLWKGQREFGWGRRRRSLKDLVNKRFKQVDQALEKGDYRKVGVETTNIFYLTLGEVAGEGGASQEISRLLSLLPPSLRRDHGDEIAKTFEIFQTLSFAPEEMLGDLKASATMKTNVSRAKKVIDELVSSKE